MLDAGQLQPSTSLPATAGGNSNEVPIDPQLGSLVGEQDPYFGFEEAALVQALGQGDPQSSSSVNTGSSVPPAASSPNSAVTWEQLLASSPQNDQQHAGQYLAPSERFEPQQPQQQSGPQQGGDNPSTVGVTDQTAQQSSRPSFQQQQDVQQQGAEEQDDQEFERLLAEYCNFPEDMGQLSEPQQPQQAAAQTPEATQEVSPEAKDEVSPEAKEEVSPRAPATTRAPVATGEQQVAPQPPENSRPPTSPESEDREGGVQVRTGEQVVTTAYSSVRIDSVLCKRLAREPARREPIQRRPGQVLNTGRRSNVEALLAHVTGQVAGEACKNCRKEHGPWTQCVRRAVQLSW
ncbi:hypothetical protein CDD83_10086 [Cordyceps sp. RAO-2017]|nr:hypothetical protein CDD83_10086 [Cordyceps sp. RAO-2017]